MLLDDFVGTHHASVHLYSPFRSLAARRLADDRERHDAVRGSPSLHLPITLSKCLVRSHSLRREDLPYTHTSLAASCRVLRHSAIRRLSLTDVQQLVGLRQSVDGLHAAGRVDHDYTRRSSGVITMPGPSLTGAGQIHRPESASLGSAPHRKPGSSRRRKIPMPR